MAAPPLRQFSPTPGFVGDEPTPDAGQLYMTPADILELYCITVSEGQIRFAQTLINTTCNRPSLWPETYEERIDVPADRQQVILSARPVLRILKADGRYGYGRRDRRTLNMINYDYLAAIAVHGSPPGYSSINIDEIDLYGATGEVWLPTGFFLVGYSEVLIQYQAGFLQIPDRVKAALIELINIVGTKGMSDRKGYLVNKIQSTYWNPGYVTDDVRNMLQPYIVTTLL